MVNLYRQVCWGRAWRCVSWVWTWVEQMDHRKAEAVEEDGQARPKPICWPGYCGEDLRRPRWPFIKAVVMGAATLSVFPSFWG